MKFRPSYSYHAVIGSTWFDAGSDPSGWAESSDRSSTISEYELRIQRNRLFRN